VPVSPPPTAAIRRLVPARLRRGLALAAALASGCGAGGSENGASLDATPVTVEALRVEPETLRDVATFGGQLSAENSVQVKTESSGVIEAILFEEGQEVAKGDVLIQMRDDEEVARMHEAEATLRLARHVHQRTRELATRDAVSEAQRDRVAADLTVAEARVDVARVALARTRVRAPFDGVLGMRLVAPGDRITAKDALVQIDAVDRLQVTFGIAEAGILFARVGAPVEVRVSPYPNEPFPGEVFFVSPSIESSTRRVILKAWVPNPQRRLRPGLFANIDLEIGQRERAIVVPESAIVFDREGTYVWKLDAEQLPTRVPVQVGLRRAGRVEVTLGIQPGDTIVISGTHKVMAGKRVAVALPLSTGQAQQRDPGRDSVGEGT
jgi:membrane fusion protein (multidrug efflux system)